MSELYIAPLSYQSLLTARPRTCWLEIQGLDMSYDAERTVTSVNQSTPSTPDSFLETSRFEDGEVNDGLQLRRQREDDLLKSYDVMARQLGSMRAEIDQYVEMGDISQSDVEFILSVTECSLRVKLFARVLKRVFVDHDDYIPAMIYEPIIEITGLARKISRPDNQSKCANTAELRKLTVELLRASIEVLRSLIRLEVRP